MLLALWGEGESDPKRFRQIQQEMMAAGKPPDRETMDNFRKEMDKLSSDEKMELGKGMFENMANQRRKEMDAYFAMRKSGENLWTIASKRVKKCENKSPQPGKTARRSRGTAARWTAGTRAGKT